VIGHSMGGTLAPLLMLFDKRVKVGASAAGLSTWRAMIDNQVLHNFGVYLPGLLTFGDLDDLCVQIAPRPFMMIAGEKDPNFPVKGIKGIVSKAKREWKDHGSVNAFKWIIHPKGHKFNMEEQDVAVSFLREWLS